MGYLFSCSTLYLTRSLGSIVRYRVEHPGWVVRKPVNANPGLKVNRSINFSCIKIFLTAYVLCSLSLDKLKTEAQRL